MTYLGIIFVIDSNDRDRLIAARDELLNLYNQLDLSSTVAIIIAANKQDLSRSFTYLFFATDEHCHAYIYLSRIIDWQ
jgi:signal recognition particle receptor subunit beta